ncbi:flagellar basal body L-ring protein FlgH [Parendozoicomonas haliclonae]|uniref:Flagellar L-ring protein n=1 Tax=Parendozoicomonas haliclonae TaxID=1960125 RepID=A0A1X7AR38_9GAMM|nr:flagellar basal body L-ring protein FlgH [Parendozoicomonas haliclonae]SMA49877.1 Flagellar L-ring protein precursor [Parendozoicomonas haliclonae]
MTVKPFFFAVLCSLLLGIQAHATSLYPRQGFQSLTSDSLALAVGDSVTVLIVEDSTASASSGDDLERGLGASGSMELTRRTESGRIGFGLDANGSDSTNRSGNLRAVVTADVIAVDPQGRLQIAGRQLIVVNGDEQLITISGWARPDHIDAQNSIVSSRLSQTRIEYSGINDEEEGMLESVWEWLASLAETGEQELEP